MSSFSGGAKTRFAAPCCDRARAPPQDRERVPGLGEACQASVCSAASAWASAWYDERTSAPTAAW